MVEPVKMVTNVVGRLTVFIKDFVAEHGAASSAIGKIAIGFISWWGAGLALAGYLALKMVMGNVFSSISQLVIVLAGLPCCFLG